MKITFAKSTLVSLIKLDEKLTKSFSKSLKNRPVAKEDFKRRLDDLELLGRRKIDGIITMDVTEDEVTYELNKDFISDVVEVCEETALKTLPLIKRLVGVTVETRSRLREIGDKYKEWM